MTLPQARRLIAAVLPLRSLSLEDAIKLVQYYTRRNNVAYKAHRKRRVAKANSMGLQVSL